MADFQSSDAIGGAVGWVSGTLSGSVATVIAVLAVGWLGLAMFQGRIELRKGAQIVFGCFMIFGATRIATGISGLIVGSSDSAAASPAVAMVAPLPLQAQAPLQPYDPYAGAALPTR